MGLVQAVATAVLAAGLVYIYVKSDRKEELLFLKLLGYYALGVFRLSLGRIAIPLGFIIYMLYMHPKQNAASKRQAAILGLIFFIIGLIVPAAEDYFFRFPIKVEASSGNLYQLDFEKDWLVLQQRFKLPNNARLQHFDAEFEDDGSIRDLCYELIVMGNEGLVHYNVNLGKEEKAYKIRRTKLDHWLQYDRLVLASRFFEVLSRLDIEDIKPRHEYEYYCISSQGETVSYGITNRQKFLIDGNNGDISSIGDEQLPIECCHISVYGMVKMEETSYESRDIKDYLFDVVGE